MIAGSPSYIAPEVWTPDSFDHRIDVYSLAAVDLPVPRRPPALRRADDARPLHEGPPSRGRA